MNDVYLFDVDGTLVSGGSILDSTKEALFALKEKGNKIFLATGRCLGQLSNILHELPLDGAILNNGALLKVGEETKFSSFISSKTLKKMLKDKLHLGFLREYDYVRVEDGPIFESFKKEFEIELPRIISEEELFQEPIYSIGVYDMDLDSVDIKPYKDLRFVKVCEIGYDVMNQGIDKSSPISVLRKLYPKSKIIAFGDNYNDMEMLQASDIKIVMGSAPKEVQDLASFVTKSSSEDGIVYALKYLRSI